MSFAFTQKLITFLMALTAAMPLVLSGEISVAVIAIFAVLVVTGWFLEPPVTSNARFRRLATGAIIAVFAVQVVRVAGGASVTSAAFEFVMILMGIKMCTRNRFSDYQQIAILSFLHIIGATIATSEMSYAVFFILFLAFCPASLTMAHLRNEMERRFRHDDSLQSSRGLKRLLASKRVISPQFILGTAGLSLPVLLFTMIIFLGFPRFGLGLFAGKTSASSIAGFTNEVHIGDIDLTRDEKTVILRLEPLKKLHNPLPRLNIKMRGAAFDIFDGNVWKRSKAKNWRRMKRKGNSYLLGERKVTDETLGFSVLQESLDPPFLFLPLGTGKIKTEPIARDGIIVPRILEINTHGMVRYEDITKVGVRYKVWLTGEPPFAPPPDDNLTALTVPPSMASVAKLGKKIAGTGSKMVQAKRIVQWLKSNFRYANRRDEEGGIGEGATSIERFLFSRHTGTCEHFATAATIMMRVVDIPSRMVTGFSGADWNRLGEFYSVRSVWAHAWTEAYIDGTWVQFDPTPAAPASQKVSEPSTLALLVDAMRMQWQKYVISFDASSQVNIARGIAEVAIDINERFGRHRITDGISWLKIFFGVLVVVLAVLIFSYRKRLVPAWRYRSGRRTGSVSKSEATALFKALERKLIRLGYPRSSTETPLEYVERLFELPPDVKLEVLQIVSRYNDVRFGGDTFSFGELVTLRSKLSQIL